MEPFFLPLFGALLGGIVALVIVSLGEMSIKKKIEELEFEEDVEQMLDAVIVSFRGQIPMAGVFLKGALEEKLKGVGRDEVTKVLPSIKKKIQKRMSENSGMLKIKGSLLGVALGFLIGWVIRF